MANEPSKELEGLLSCQTDDEWNECFDNLDRGGQFRMRLEGQVTDELLGEFTTWMINQFRERTFGTLVLKKKGIQSNENRVLIFEKGKWSDT